MSRAKTHSYSYLPASGPVGTIKPTSPVCPECHSSVNRVSRRFVDRLLSLVYPVHRYHCRSFVCNWEGNLRCTTELGRWEVQDAWSDATASGYRAAVLAPSTGATDPPPAAPAPRAATTDTPPDGTRRRESDTLPMPPSSSAKTKKPDARAEPRDGTNAPRRASQRAKATLR